MNEAIDRLLWERQRLDRGLPATALASLAAHLGLAGLAVGLPLLLPQEPPLKVAPGAAVLDTSHLTIGEVCERVLSAIRVKKLTLGDTRQV